MKKIAFFVGIALAFTIAQSGPVFAETAKPYCQTLDREYKVDAMGTADRCIKKHSLVKRNGTQPACLGGYKVEKKAGYDRCKKIETDEGTVVAQ